MNLSKMRIGLVGIIGAGSLAWVAASGLAGEIEPGTAAKPETVVACFDDQPGGGTNVFPGTHGWKRYELRAGNAAVLERPLRSMYDGPGVTTLRKMPLMIFGHEDVRVSTAPRAEGIRLRYGREPIAEVGEGLRSIIFRPCTDRPRTLFGGAIEVKGRRPVRLKVTTAGETTSHTWNLGRPGPAETEAQCRPRQVMTGSGTPGWRRTSIDAGPVGIRKDPLRDMSRTSDGQRLSTKMPIMIAGHRPVEIAAPLGQLDRIDLSYGRINVNLSGDVPGADVIRFEPCENKVRTVWPGGIRVKGRKPVRLRVTVGNDPPFMINLGRPRMYRPN